MALTNSQQTTSKLLDVSLASMHGNTGTIFDTIVREMSFSLDLIEDRDFPKRGIRLPLFSWTELEEVAGMGGLAMFFSIFCHISGVTSCVTNM